MLFAVFGTPFPPVWCPSALGPSRSGAAHPQHFTEPSGEHEDEEGARERAACPVFPGQKFQCETLPRREDRPVKECPYCSSIAIKKKVIVSASKMENTGFQYGMKKGSGLGLIRKVEHGGHSPCQLFGGRRLIHESVLPRSSTTAMWSLGDLRSFLSAPFSRALRISVSWRVKSSARVSDCSFRLSMRRVVVVCGCAFGEFARRRKCHRQVGRRFGADFCLTCWRRERRRETHGRLRAVDLRSADREVGVLPGLGEGA